jgi:hypothetical protein
MSTIYVAHQIIESLIILPHLDETDANRVGIMKCKHTHVFLYAILMKCILVVNIIYFSLDFIHLFAQINNTLQGKTRSNLEICSELM